jgi:hypothetical protein
MEKESFENREIADVMNNNYVCIKVDREERPDIDQIYMKAVQLMNGRGGWPLNCIALPDTRPVYGGTYFKPDDWKFILTDIAEQYKRDKLKFLEAAESIQTGMIQSDYNFQMQEKDNNTFEALKKSLSELERHFDTEEGGFNGAPKFPMPTFWRFLQDYSFYVNDSNIQNQLELTLLKMRKGGINDQIGGGFSRYSTDRNWKVPHFEKMLYDNAQLVSLYSFAYKRTGNKLYLQTITQTLAFVVNEMNSEEGAFYSSYDADSEGIEGKYYTWERDEIVQILGNNAILFNEFYNVKPEGNWEMKFNILHEIDEPDSLAPKYGLDENELRNKISELSSMVYKERLKKVKPGLDDKILTSWNALMISGFMDAYEATGNELYLTHAEKTADFIITKLMGEDYALKRTYKNGHSKINGFLDDYAFTIESFIKVFQATGNENFITLSKHLIDYVNLHFYDPKTRMYYYTSDLAGIIVERQKEIPDNVIPSSNSVMAKNLKTIGILFSDPEFTKRSESMIQNITDTMLKNLEYFGQWASLKLQSDFPSFEVIVTGKDYRTILKKLKTKLRPDVLFAGTDKKSMLPIFIDRYVEGKNLIYICKNSVCALPVESTEEAELLIH